MKNNVKDIATKWYKELGYPKEYDAFFENILLRDDMNEKLLKKSMAEIIKIGDVELSLVYALLKCEELEKRYIQAGISVEIFKETISDIKTWSIDFFERNDKLGLEHIGWISHHLNFELFKLGRLQFNFTAALYDCPSENIKKGDNVIGVHITRNEPLTPGKCAESFATSKLFFDKFFPEYKYAYYTCSSWLLSPDLNMLLRENSNILKFQKLFKIIKVVESDLILSFIFRWGTHIDDIDKVECKTYIQKKVKEYVKAGKKLHDGYGIINKNDLYY